MNKQKKRYLFSSFVKSTFLDVMWERGWSNRDSRIREVTKSIETDKAFSRHTRPTNFLYISSAPPVLRSSPSLFCLCCLVNEVNRNVMVIHIDFSFTSCKCNLSDSSKSLLGFDVLSSRDVIFIFSWTLFPLFFDHLLRSKDTSISIWVPLFRLF